MPRLSVNKPSDTSSPRRRSWFSLKRHVQAPPHASPPLPNVPHVPDLIASGPSSSSSHETPPTPADRCSGDDFPLKRPHIRSRLSEDAYTSDDPHPPQHNVHVSPSAVTLPRTHAVSAESPKRNSLVSLIRDSSRKARKLRKLTSSRPDTMPPPSAFPAAIFQRHHEPHIFSGTVSVPAVTMRPTARMARIPSDQIFAPQQLYTSMDPSATAPALTQYTLYPPSPVLADCSTPSDSGSSLALNTPAHVSPDASSTSLTPQSPNRRRPRTVLQAQSEDGHASSSRLYSRPTSTIPIRPSASVAFLPGTRQEKDRKPRPESILSTSTFLSASSSRTTTMWSSPTNSTATLSSPSIRRQLRKLTKRRPEELSPMTPHVSTHASVLSLPTPQCSPQSPPVRPLSMMSASSHSAPSTTRFGRSRSDHGHGTKLTRAASDSERVYGSRAIPVSDTPPVLPAITSVITPPSSPRTRNSSWLPRTSPSPKSSPSTLPALDALSRLTMGADSSSIAAQLSSGTIGITASSSSPTMLDQQWTLVEKVPEHARDGFDPYADASPVNKGLLAAPGSPRKRRRSFSRSHDGHQTSASRSRSRSRGRGSKGASPVRGNKGKSRSRSRTRSRSRSAVREATGSFVRMRGSREDNPMRRWTLAMADSCYDGAVLAEFDALHRHGPGSIKDRRPRKRRELALLDEQAEDDVEEMQQMRMDVVYGGPPSEDQHESNAESSQNARRALLSCRELVRAEKVYQTVLLQLLDGKTRTPPPALMQTYLPALVHTSMELLAALSEDPTAWGVSMAFILLAPALEAAFVPWCGVVGQWFSDAPIPPIKKEKSSTQRIKIAASMPTTPVGTVATRRKVNHNSRPRASLEFIAEVDSNTPFATRQGLASITPFTNNIPTTPVTPSSVSLAFPVSSAAPSPKIYRSLNSWRRSGATPNTSTTSLGETAESVKPLRERMDSFAVPGMNGKVPLVRDLAIQPTQRVMRYVLQYGDLLSYTPKTSASYPIVAQALDTALALARKCDRAQDNAAFLLKPTT